MKDWEAAIFGPLSERKIIPDPDSSRSVAGYVLNSFSKVRLAASAINTGTFK